MALPRTTRRGSGSKGQMVRRGCKRTARQGGCQLPWLGGAGRSVDYPHAEDAEDADPRPVITRAILDRGELPLAF
jgi:hypothetical protein